MDLDKIFADISVGSLFWHGRLEAAILSLDSMPERCAAVPKLSTLQRIVRQVLFLERGHTYLVYFTFAGNTVRVIHIRSGSWRPLRRL